MGKICEFILFIALLFCGGFIKPVKLGEKNNLIFLLEKYRWIIICFISVMATVYSSFFPFSVKAPSADSAVFAYIGKCMTLGKIPYKDMFDHKGILLYFYEYLGCLITGKSFFGLWIIELVSMLATVWLLFKIVSTISKNEIIKVLAILITLFYSLKKFWTLGNLVEEYALPFIAYAIFIGNKFLKEQVINKKEAFILGLCMMAVVLLRVNMIVAWCAVCPLIVLNLGYKKQWKELFSFILCFICGMLALSAPIIIYFILTNSLKDFIDQYLIFNFSYVNSNGTFSNILSVNKTYIKILVEVVIAILIALVPKRKDKWYWFNNFLFFISMLAITVSGRFYEHYIIILIPTMVVTNILAIESIFQLFGKIKRKINIKLFEVAFCISFMFLMAFVFYTNIGNQENTINEENGCIKWLEENTKENDDVLILGNNCYSYLMSDRYTNYKYFYQTPIIDVNDKIYSEFVSELNNKPSDYIVYINKEIDRNSKRLNEVLNKLNAETNTGKYNQEDHGSFLVFSLNK